MIDWICGKCQHKQSVPDNLAGTSRQCPQCGASTSVPRTRAAPPAVVWGLLGSVLLGLGVVIILYCVLAGIGMATGIGFGDASTYYQCPDCGARWQPWTIRCPKCNSEPFFGPIIRAVIAMVITPMIAVAMMRTGTLILRRARRR